MGEREGEEGNKIHVLVVPLSDGQGHINPILQFSKRLAFKGLTVTLLNILRHNNNNEQHQHHSHSSIHVEHRPRLPYQGPQPESMDSHMARLRASISFHITDLVARHRTSPAPVRCLIYDSIMPWVLDVAKGLGVFGAPFFTESCAVNAIFYHLSCGSFTIPVDPSFALALPALPPLRVSDLPSLVSSPDRYSGFLDFMVDQFSNQPDWMFINTFNSLEPQVIEWMQSHTSLKTVGPTVPSTITDKRLTEDHEYGISLFKSSEDDSKIMEWLDSKDRNSVIYMSFGSVTKLGGEQLEELALGLKATKATFLWVLRDSEIPKLPTNFLEEMEEKGRVVNWCPQLRVLGHESVGCFVTHCGWNSVLEALSLGVPMVAMPQWADQTTNAKFVEDVWKVGVRVSPMKNGVVGREEIELCIKGVMEGERSVEMRENANKWMKLAREAVDEDGTSDKNIDEFVAQLTNATTAATKTWWSSEKGRRKRQEDMRR